ncbi:MAG: HNH endonuclease, partial [Pseudomonadota bacterium]
LQTEAHANTQSTETRPPRGGTQAGTFEGASTGTATDSGAGSGAGSGFTNQPPVSGNTSPAGGGLGGTSGGAGDPTPAAESVSQAFTPATQPSTLSSAELGSNGRGVFTGIVPENNEQNDRQTRTTPIPARKPNLGSQGASHWDPDTSSWNELQPTPQVSLSEEFSTPSSQIAPNTLQPQPNLVEIDTPVRPQTQPGMLETAKDAAIKTWNYVTTPFETMEKINEPQRSQLEVLDTYQQEVFAQNHIQGAMLNGFMHSTDSDLCQPMVFVPETILDAAVYSVGLAGTRKIISGNRRTPKGSTAKSKQLSSKKQAANNNAANDNSLQSHVNLKRATGTDTFRTFNALDPEMGRQANRWSVGQGAKSSAHARMSGEVARENVAPARGSQRVGESKSLGGGTGAQKSTHKEQIKSKSSTINQAERNPIDINAHSKAPYSPQGMRDMLEARYPGSKVESTTLPYKGAKGTKFAGQRHPKTKVVYDMRASPDFTPYMKYEVQIPFAEYNKKAANSSAHMRYATRQLRVDIKSGKVNANQFKPQELKAIMSGKRKIPGHTWEHNSRRGRMQLVKEKPHARTPHVGGSAMNKKIDKIGKKDG